MSSFMPFYREAFMMWDMFPDIDDVIWIVLKIDGGCMAVVSDFEKKDNYYSHYIYKDYVVMGIKVNPNLLNDLELMKVGKYSEISEEAKEKILKTEEYKSHYKFVKQILEKDHTTEEGSVSNFWYSLTGVRIPKTQELWSLPNSNDILVTPFDSDKFESYYGIKAPSKKRR
jgi:hypothetical protein